MISFKRLSRLTFCLTMLICQVILFSGCSERNEGPKKSNKNLIIFNGAEPETLDPALSQSVSDGRILNGLFEGLCELDAKTLAPTPGCASWTISKDRRTYTFLIRPDAKWSDGQRVTAHDFAYAWQRILTPATGAPYASLLFCIDGAEAFYQKETSDFTKVGVKAVDANILQVRLVRPIAHFPELCAFTTFRPVPKHIVEKFGEHWTADKTHCSNGAFKLDKWQLREKVVLAKNPHYHGQSTVKLDAITFLSSDNVETAYWQFTTGAIHWLPSIPQTKLDEIIFDPDYYVTPYLGTYFYRFNVTRPPFDQVKVRQAFIHAINREILTGQVLRGGERPTTGFIPDMDGYQSRAGLAFDPQKAKQLLKEAGYGPNNPFPKVVLTYNTSDNHKRLAEAMVQQWEEYLGVKVSLDNKEWNVFLTEQKNLNYQISRSGWIGDYSEPSTFTSMFEPGNGNNRTGWESPAYGDLAQKAREAESTEARMAIYAQMEQLLLEKDAVILPIYTYVNKGLLSNQVTGWYPNIMDYHPLKDLDLVIKD